MKLVQKVIGNNNIVIGGSSTKKKKKKKEHTIDIQAIEVIDENDTEIKLIKPTHYDKD